MNYYDPEMLQATALHWAANNGHEDTVRKLIEMGASVMPTNQVGGTCRVDVPFTVDMRDVSVTH